MASGGRPEAPSDIAPRAAGRSAARSFSDTIAGLAGRDAVAREGGEMSAQRSVLDAGVRAALDAIEQPVSVASAVRDSAGRLLDFRLEHVNGAAARWGGLSPEAIVGRLLTELIPEVRTDGLFDALDRVVATGQPFHQRAAHHEGRVTDGRRYSARFELAAVAAGDGYLSAWAEIAEGGDVDLERVLERARRALRPKRLAAIDADARPRDRRRRLGWAPARAGR